MIKPPEEGTKFRSELGSSIPSYKRHLTERSMSPSSMEAVTDSESSGNVSLEDGSHPSPAHGSAARESTGERLESSVATSSSSKCAGHDPSRSTGQKPATAALATGKPKGYLSHPGAEASKESTGKAPHGPTAVSVLLGDIAGDIAEFKLHNPSTHPEAFEARSRPAPLSLEE